MTTSPRHIRLTGSFASADLERLVVALAPLEELREPAVVTLDLAGIERISAPSVAVLVSALLDAVAYEMVAPGSKIVMPHDAEVQRQLQELDVLELLAARPPHESFVRGRDRGKRPCQRFTADDDPGEVARSLTDAVAEVCPTDGPACNAIWFALNEIAQNVIDHAGARGGGVGIAEVTHGGAELEVAIADHGVGVRRSLARNPSYSEISSDLVALRTAVRAGVTARPEKPGGLGLFVTQVLLRENGGGMVVRSGTAEIELGAAPAEAFDLIEMRGTLVTLRFRTDQPFSLDPLLAALERE